MRLITLCTAALVGLALGDLGRLGMPPRLAFAGLVALLGAALAWRQPTWRWLALCACAVAAGGLRAAMVEPAPMPALDAYAGQVVRLHGRLLGRPMLSSTGAAVRLSLEVDAIGPGGHDPAPVAGFRLNVVADPAVLDPSPFPGDAVLLGAPVVERDANALSQLGLVADHATVGPQTAEGEAATLGARAAA